MKKKTNTQTQTQSQVNLDKVSNFLNQVVDAECRIFTTNAKEGYYLRAFVNIELDCGLVIKDLKIMTNAATNESFISFPSAKAKDGNYYPTVYLDSEKYTQDEKKTIMRELCDLIIQNYM